MKIETKYANPLNVGGRRTRPIEYIVVHYTANRGDTAKNNAVYFARETVNASAHYFVDEHTVWRSVADDVIAWHCGGKLQGDKGHTFYGKCRNSNSIGVEMCLLDKAGGLRKGTIERAAQLVRELMEKYHVDAAHVIRHFDVTGKNCPAPMVKNEALWQAFQKKLVKRKEEEPVRIYKSIKEMPKWAQPTVEKLTRKKLLLGNGDGSYSVSEDMLRVLVITDRAGIYEKMSDAE